MSYRRALIATLFGLASLACLAPTGTTPGVPKDVEEYLIAPPDVLAISVRPEPEILRELAVRPDGRISFDLIGDIEVEGKSVVQVQEEITRRISEYIVSPTVVVTLAESNSRRFHVFGEVMRPGSYPLIGRVTALDALGTAGGPTRFAALSSGRLIRPRQEEGQVYAVNFDSISLRGQADSNYELQPGDVVYVPPNASASLGYALQIIFYPLQQILGLGGTAVRTIYVPGGA
jgi:polysaccharide export outer membrane protein